MILLFQEDFTNETEVIVNHNLNRIDVGVRVIGPEGAPQDAFISSAIFNPQDERNSIVVRFSSSASGRIQVIDAGSTVVYPAKAIPSISVGVKKDTKVVYGKKSEYVPFNDIAGLYENEYFSLGSNLVRVLRPGIYDVSFRVMSQFEKSNRARTQSEMRLAKFDSNGDFVEYWSQSVTYAYHENRTDGKSSGILPNIEVQMATNEQLGIIIWRRSGRDDLIILPEGTSMTVKLVKDL